MMRHQKTAPREPGELRDLSVQEQAFVEALGQGDDNSVAFQKAYGPQTCSVATLRVKACHKAAEPKIRAHLAALRAVGFSNARLTLEGRIEAELAFAQRAETSGNWGAAGGAFDRINKLLGLYCDRSEMVVKSADPDVTLRELAAMIGEDKIEVRH
jgi:hypothetical protein